MNLLEKIKHQSQSISEKLSAIRRHIHQNPELSFQEFETTKFIENELEKIGITHHYRILKTGVIAEIEGHSEGRSIALRADIDALPIVEVQDRTYRSLNEGLMHACGHDVHTTCLLGAAHLLFENRDLWKGKIQLIFQPGEEKLPGGASLLIEKGLFENFEPEAILGQHVHPELEAGKVGYRAGMFMASADEIYISIKGKGGHAAQPHKTTDPVLCSANLLVQLQQVVSRNCPPNIPSVLSFGKIVANGATNIIPSEVHLEGTFRTMNEEWRSLAHQRIEEMCESIGKATNNIVEVNILKGYPFLENDSRITQIILQGAKEFLGEENVVELEPRMTAEDFAWYTQQVPGCFYRLGTGNVYMGITSGVHTSNFDVDEKALSIGAGLMAWNALKILE
jgi:amidohydrolase